MHGNVASFWNRGNVYSRMNLNDTIFLDKFENQSGLYENMAILIYGDHNGLSMYDEELQDFLKENNPNITDVDLKPTFAYLCNIEDGFSLGTNIFTSKDFVCLNNERIIAKDFYYDGYWYNIVSGKKVDLDNIPQEEKQKIDKYYEYMKKKLDISFSVNINNLLKQDGGK